MCFVSLFVNFFNEFITLIFFFFDLISIMLLYNEFVTIRKATSIINLLSRKFMSKTCVFMFNVTFVVILNVFVIVHIALY